MMISTKVDEWARQCGSRSPQAIPFNEWPDTDPLVELAMAYGLSGKDLDKILVKLADELERRAERAGYEEAWL